MYCNRILLIAVLAEALGLEDALCLCIVSFPDATLARRIDGAGHETSLCMGPGPGRPCTS